MQRKRWFKWALYMLAALFLGIGGLGGALYFELHRSNGEVLTGRQKRAYLLHVPKTIPSNRPMPLVICLHGFAEWPTHLQRLSHWNQLADECGFLVVYPRGSGFPFRWRCGGWFGKQAELSQDVQFISDLIDQLKKEYRIDEGLRRLAAWAVPTSCLGRNTAQIGPCRQLFSTEPLIRSFPSMAHRQRGYAAFRIFHCG